MKFAAIILALATAAVAVPVALDSAPLELRDLAPELELRDLDTVAINHLVSRGIFEEAELAERGLFSSKSKLQVTFTDPSGPVSAARQKQATKVLQKAVSKAQQAQFPFCSVACVCISLPLSRSSS